MKLFHSPSAPHYVSLCAPQASISKPIIPATTTSFVHFAFTSIYMQVSLRPTPQLPFISNLHSVAQPPVKSSFASDFRNWRRPQPPLAPTTALWASFTSSPSMKSSPCLPSFSPIDRARLFHATCFCRSLLRGSRANGFRSLSATLEQPWLAASGKNHYEITVGSKEWIGHP